jgi:hypothetical protein
LLVALELAEIHGLAARDSPDMHLGDDHDWARRSAATVHSTTTRSWWAGMSSTSTVNVPPESSMVAAKNAPTWPWPL